MRVRVSGGGEQSSGSLKVTLLSQIKLILRVPTNVRFPPERYAVDIVGLVLFLMAAIQAGLKPFSSASKVENSNNRSNKYVLHLGSLSAHWKLQLPGEHALLVSSGHDFGV